MDMNEHEFEPVKGMPSALPEGETLVWQGSPKWQSLAIRAFHVRKVAIYFLVLMSVSLASSMLGQDSFTTVLPSVQALLIVASLTIGILSALAYAYSQSTVYSLTNKRIVLRVGVAVQMMINIPWEKIESAGLREYSDGTGDILLETNSDERISYVALWPNARPWHFTRAQPLLRSLSDAQIAGEHISTLLNQQVRVERKSAAPTSTQQSSLATTS